MTPYEHTIFLTPNLPDHPQHAPFTNATTPQPHSVTGIPLDVTPPPSAPQTRCEALAKLAAGPDWRVDLTASEARLLPSGSSSSAPGSASVVQGVVARELASRGRELAGMAERWARFSGEAGSGRPEAEMLSDRVSIAWMSLFFFFFSCEGGKKDWAWLRLMAGTGAINGPVTFEVIFVLPTFLNLLNTSVCFVSSNSTRTFANDAIKETPENDGKVRETAYEVHS